MLNINAITVRMGGRIILDHASAALPPRSHVGMVGRNGAGKSTLLKIIAGVGEADDGAIEMPRGTRIGYVAQEAPAGPITPLETVLAADTERADLLARAERATETDAIAEIHDRLDAIDAHSAPARAARILAGLGFEEDAQHRAMDSFSGGWRTRVALAAVLFSEPDLLLLDEPSNHLDLEATMWLESFLKSCRSTLLVVSHERDLLNNVVDHILHVDNGKTKLYVGGYDSFERQRREHQEQVESMRAQQDAKRAKLQAFVDRWRYKAHTAKQAQSRLKAIAKMEPIAAVADDPTLVFDFPSPDKVRPPLLSLEQAAVGYVPGKPILSNISLRLDPDDRIALLGPNGNGKTTLARLLSGRLPAQAGSVSATGKLKIGFFTQHQVEELDVDDTPLQHMARAMPEAKPSQVRGQLGRFGFSGDKAEVLIGKLSGGERARLALALITREAPHIMILDEPTNHLDVDAREALVQALNDYEGAVVIVSHDRHLIEMTADRLILVGDGTAKEYTGTLDEYRTMILNRGAGAGEERGKPAARVSRKDERRLAAAARERTQTLRKTVKQAEAEVTRLAARRTEIDRALFDPKSYEAAGNLTVGELMRARTDIERKLQTAEARWLEATEALERAEAEAA